MKRYISILFMIIICFIMQTTIFRYLELAHISPNLVLTVVAISGFMYGRKLGMFSGVIAGLLIDLMYNDVVGVCIIIFTAVGYVNGMANKLYFKDDLSIPIIFMGISDIAYGILYYICTFLLRGRLNFFSYFKGVILPEMIYTLITGVVIFKIIHILDEKLYPPVEVPLENKKTY